MSDTISGPIEAPVGNRLDLAVVRVSAASLRLLDARRAAATAEERLAAVVDTSPHWADRRAARARVRRTRRDVRAAVRENRRARKDLTRLLPAPDEPRPVPPTVLPTGGTGVARRPVTVRIENGR